MKPTRLIQILQRLQGQLLGVQFIISFFKIMRHFDAFISTGIKSHILAPSVLIDSLQKCTVSIGYLVGVTCSRSQELALVVFFT